MMNIIKSWLYARRYRRWVAKRPRKTATEMAIEEENSLASIDPRIVERQKQMLMGMLKDQERRRIAYGPLHQPHSGFFGDSFGDILQRLMGRNYPMSEVGTDG